MKTFLHSFAGTMAAVVAILGLVAIIGSCSMNRTSKIEDGSWLIVELNGGLPEYDPPGGPLNAVTQGATETLQRVLDNLAMAAADERIAGVVLKIGRGSGMGFASMEEVRHAIAKVQAADKKVYAWAEAFDEKSYVLIAAADEIFAPPTTSMTFTGAVSGSVHVKNAMEMMGIKPEIHKIKDYKSAAELMTRDSMSEPARENKRWLLEEGWSMAMEIMAEDRNQSEEEIVALMEHVFFTGDEALEAGLVDKLMYWDELEDMLKPEGEEKLAMVSMGRYAKEDPADFGLYGGKKKIAVIHAQGTIAGRKNGVNPLLGTTMGFETIVEELRRAREDEDVAAIVLRVDSPGGDALTSDFMGHAVEQTVAVKPVIVSMVNVAASGGYHISYRASHILANRMTVTGSIGSITGRFNMDGMFQKMGITHDFETKGPSALVNSSFADLTPELSARFAEDHWNSFNHWLRDVAEHRGMTFEKAETLAHGRVWSGRQALENGLVDELGGLDRAVAVAREMGGIEADAKVTVAHYPEKKSFIQSLMSDGDKAAAARWLVYGALRHDIQQTLDIVGSQPQLVLDPVTP